MAHDTTTRFPANIDDRKYYSDVVLQHADILQEYRQLVNNGQYKQSSQYLYDSIDVPGLDMDYNGAYQWNRIETERLAIEQYALEMEGTAIKGTYSSTEPRGKVIGHVWIS